jgi:hypothetical protein
MIQSDGKGYYAWLPAIFIYHDLNFEFYEKTEIQNSYDKNRVSDYRVNHNGQTLDKFTAGTGLCILPFFLAAHFLTVIFGYPADGYSQLYAIFVNIAALFYLFTGLHFLKKLLRLYNFKEGIISLILIAIVFGTNLFYYVIGEPSMSHIYSFAVVSIFLYYIKFYFMAPGRRPMLISALSLGIILLIRPVNALILAAVPFLAGTRKNPKSGLMFQLRNPDNAIISCILLLFVLVIQPVLFKIQSGEFLVYTYPGEGFNFLHPHILKVLFSYKKGLFLYTPMLLISLIGFIALFRKNRFEASSLLIFLGLITYVFSSWWNWWYGGSFSSRVYVEYLPFFAILLAYSVTLIPKGKLRITYVSIVLLLIMVCQIQTLQYRYLQIHWEEMTKEKYWDNFLRIDKVLKERSDNKTQ